MAKKTYPAPTSAMQKDSLIIAEAFKKAALLKHNYLNAPRKEGKINTLLVNKYIDKILTTPGVNIARARLSKINGEDPLKTIKLNTYHPTNSTWNVENDFTFKPFTYVPPIIIPPKSNENKKKEQVTNIGSKQNINTFNTTVQNAINPAQPVEQNTILPIKETPTITTIQQQAITPATIQPVISPAFTTPKKLTAYKNQTVMYPDGSYELRQVPYYIGNDRGTWTQGTNLNPPGVVNATDLSPEEFNLLKNKNKLQPTPTTSQQFLDGGPLVDKTNHGKLLNSVYASALGNYYPLGGPINTSGPRAETLPALTESQMKAKMAYEQAIGNKAADRMLSLNPKTYDFGDGTYGTHYMSTFGNYAVPLLQDKGGQKLEYNENPPVSKEDFRFQTPEEADYFATHYKTIAPMITGHYKYGGQFPTPYSLPESNYYANGGMIKRADGSYSQRGLWDNIRANKGSGKKPTKEMLAQEKKINKEYADGGYLGDNGNTQVHTDKAGNTTTKFIKPDGTTYIKVKNANGKEYNKTIPAMKPMAYTQSEEYKQGIQYPQFNVTPADNTNVVKPLIQAPITKPVLANRNEQKALAQHLVNTGAASRYLGDNYDGSKTLNEAMLEKIQQNPNIMNSINKQEYQYLLNKEQKAYDKASPLEKTASFVHSAIADPMLVSSNLLEGKAPMLWQGVNMRDDRNPETQTFYNQATGANDNTLNTAFNFVNPGDWGTYAGIEADKGNYGTALGTLGLGIAGTAIGGPMFTGKGAAKALNKVDDLATNTYNKVATGNSVLPIAWKMEQPIANATAIKNSRALTNEEAEVLRAYKENPYSVKWNPEYRKILDNITKTSTADLSQTNQPLTRINNYYVSKSSNPELATGYGTKITYPSQRSWSIGEGITEGFANEGKQRLIMPSKYAKQAKGFHAIDYTDPRLTTNNVSREAEKEIFGNVPEGYKVIGKSNEGGFENIFVKPIKGKGKVIRKPGDPKFKSEIDWSKWNSEIPKNKALMQEYNTIEQTSKANNTWMKNSDGSKFKGTPEQFVQQNSENFKKAFPNPVLDDVGNVQYNYHGTPNELKDNMFKEHLSEGKLYGHGLYTTPKKDYALGYAQKKGNNNPNQKVYELYQNANKKQELTSVIEKSDERLKSFLKENPKGSKDFDKKFKIFMKQEDDLFEKYYDPNDFKLKQGFDYFKPNDLEQVVPYSNYPKSAIGNNGMFDMTNPNIYKSIAPITVGAGTVGAAVSQDTGYANGGQFTQPYSLPEDSFMQGGNNLHNSIYASSMKQYPASYEYGGPMSHFYASNIEEPATIGKDLAYELGGTMNIENDIPPSNTVKPKKIDQRTAQIYAIVTNEIAKARAEGKLGVNEDLNIDGVVAQILLESGNGESKLVKTANNFGGLVADEKWTGSKSESGKYRKYATPEEGLAAQVKFYLENPRYRKSGVFNAKTAEEHLQAVQKAGYAEAPDYVEKAMGMVKAIPKRLKNAGYVAGTQPVAQEQVVTTPIEQSSDIVIPDALPVLYAQPIEIKPNFVSEPTTTIGTGGGEATLQTPTITPLESTVPKGWFGSGKSLFLDKTSPFNYGGTMNPIHINPENKGKFNATKARTGKTTEELTHSPNALTRKRAIFAQNASHWNHQYGGYMFAEGGNLDLLTTFDEGGKHSENPLGGIPQGQNAQGGMNLVEEGETKLNSKDYIFSDTLKVDKDIATEFNLPKTMVGKTFADASKKMNRPDSRRVNDSIEEKAKEKDLNALMEAQEVFKQKEVAKKMEEIQSLNPGLFEQMQQPQMQPQGQPQPSPEEMMMQQGQPPMDPAMQQQMVAPQQDVPQQYGGQMSYKCGGSMYDFGGALGEGVKNLGLGMADTGLGMLGMNNVIQDNQYNGTGANFAKGWANVVGKAGKAVLPVAANMVVPGSGAVISGAQQLGSMANPQQEQEQIAQQNGINFKYGGTFDMPRQQMYMPLDHVTEMGGPRDIQYTEGGPTGYTPSWITQGIGSVNDNSQEEFSNLDSTLENKQTAFNMKETPGQFIGSNIAPAYNLYQGLFGKVAKTPKAGEMFKGVDPYKMNINPAIRATEQAYASAAKDYKNATSNAGEYLAGRSNLATQEAMNKSALNTQAENAYGQAKMQTDMFNSQGMSAAKLKEYEFALAAQAAKQNYLQEGLKQIGDKTAAEQAQQAGLMYANIHGGGNFQVDYTPYTKQLMSIFGNK